MRLFVAVNLPPELREAVWRTVDPLRGASGDSVRWVGPDGIHVTLKFLGEVADERLEELGAALGRAAAGAKPFDVIIEGGGVFPGPGRPRVFWAGIVPDPQLELLQHAVEQEIGPLGFPPEGRAFRPHLTLGRAGRDASPGRLRPVAERLAALDLSGTAHVETVDLMRSTLSPRGASYDAVVRARLG